jgi:hypothetical protein
MKALRIPPRARSIRIGYLTLVMAFAGGWASASAPFAAEINTGLVNAFSSVGQNLLGEAVFDAVAVPPNPTLPQGAVQLDVALDAQIPVAMGVFVPPNPTTPDPCRKFVQLEVQDGNVVVAVDPDAAPDGFSTAVEFKSLAAFAPRVDRCAAPLPTQD